LDDGVIFDTSTAATEVIRDEDLYPGVRVSMAARLSTARPGFHVDLSVGDPVIPPPVTIHIPRLLGGDIALRGYPLAMVHAEKIVTTISRGTTSTRWRDFADIYLLTRHQPINGSELRESILQVARHRITSLAPLRRYLPPTASWASNAGTPGGADSNSMTGCPPSSPTSSQQQRPSPTLPTPEPPQDDTGTPRPAAGHDRLGLVN
jgi:nucleotidyltransferase AbiEii toxin of type IV toxin-antitoxin system